MAAVLPAGRQKPAIRSGRRRLRQVRMTPTMPEISPWVPGPCGRSLSARLISRAGLFEKLPSILSQMPSSS